MMDSPSHEQAGTAQGSGLVSRRPKKWWVGALWALVSPPTACLHVGRPKWAAAGFGGLFVWIIFCLATGFEARILGVAVAMGLGLTYAMLPVAFALLAHTQGKAPRHGSFRLYAVSLAAWLMLLVFIWLSSTRTVGLGLYRIAADSMENTLVPGDYLLADLRAYDRQSPARGDVVVHTDPRRRETALIKRIAGLPGDTIQLKYKLLYVNGKLINPPRTATYLDPKRIFPAELSPRDNYGPAVVPPDTYFVLGDNRDNSLDSRFWGFVPRGSIDGRAELVLLSLVGLALCPDRFRLRVELIGR